MLLNIFLMPQRRNHAVIKGGPMEDKIKRFKAATSFMTEEHRRVHHFVVRELPYAGEPLAPEFIAGKLGLPHDRVVFLLDDLEKHKTFLFRNAQGEVTWTYPVTVDKTPHHLTFSSGEQVYAA
jgi:hypothetical protein